MYQWEDGTVAYYSRYERYAWPPSCALIEKGGILLMGSVTLAPNPSTKPLLCEKEEIEEANDREYGLFLIHLNYPDNASLRFNHVVCSSGHYTHKFLACDVQSACRHRDSLGENSGVGDAVMDLCRSLVAMLFACRNDVEHVAYSLVCDHSQDCLDSSDEDFCVYPSCSRSGQFECSDKQVRRKASDRIINSLLTVTRKFSVMTGTLLYVLDS